MAVFRDFAEAYLQMHFLNHGGLTNAAFNSVFTSRRRLRDSNRTTFGYRTTAGSRPPLLVERAFVHRKNRFSPADIRTPTKERGASAPRGFTTATAPAFVSAPMAVFRDFAEAYLQVRFPNHGGLTNVAPGRVFARR
jgi:hypothetical protein